MRQNSEVPYVSFARPAETRRLPIAFLFGIEEIFMS